MWKRAARTAAFLGSVALCSGAAFFSCNQADSGGKSTTSSGTTSGQATEAALVANEWVGFHSETPLVPADFDALASSLFGTSARAGQFLKDKEITPGVFLTSSAESASPDQTRLTIAFDDGTNPRRTLAVAPASFAIGGVFITTVDAALAKMQADNKAQPGSGETFYLEYRVTSAMGGKLSFGVRGSNGVYTLVVDVASPHTGLDKDKIGKPVDTFDAYDTVAGTVYFHMSQDDFDFFTNHAYGSGATSKQNFTDFKLVPHDWLRLSVEPHLDEKFVDVGFEVVGTDGKRTPVAKAPASVLAGDTFRSLVLRNMQTMHDQEANQTGSSTPWQSPFYYDNPDGGGVVQVIAQGALGIYSVAYSIESPRSALHDVPFVKYQDVTIDPPDPDANATCDKLGDPTIQLAPKGTLNITFAASDTIKTSPDLKGPLKGTIYCDVFHASDVDVTGPIGNAMSLQSIKIDNADLSTGAAPVTAVTDELYAGDYQILCAQDLDGDGGASTGDPVTLPIGSYTVACNKNPVTVEFAILDPQ